MALKSVVRFVRRTHPYVLDEDFEECAFVRVHCSDACFDRLLERWHAMGFEDRDLEYYNEPFVQRVSCDPCFLPRLEQQGLLCLEYERCRFVVVGFPLSQLEATHFSDGTHDGFSDGAYMDNIRNTAEVMRMYGL